MERRFDALFATKTGYWALDERIGLTRAKKTSLLMVLVQTRRNWTQDSGCRGRSVLGLGWLRGRGTPSWVGPPGRGVRLLATSTTEFPGRTRYRSYPVIEERAKELNLGASCQLLSALTPIY